MRHCTARALGLLLTLPLLAPGPLSGLQSTVPVIRAQPQALTRSVSETADSLFDAMEPIASRSARENARLGSQVWELTDALLAADPDDAFGNDVRGKLHQEVMKLAGWQRLLGRLFLRSDPLKKASWQASEEHLRRAIELEPRSILFYLDLGETYLLQEKDDLARETSEAGLALPDTYPPDNVFKGQMRRMLDRIEAAGTR